MADEVRERILDELEQGRSLRQISRMEGMPSPPTILGWCDKDTVFAEQYADARRKGYLQMAEELLEIADDGRNDFIELEDGRKVVDQEYYQRSRLRVDTRKWLLSKCLPKIYGDKLAHVGPDGEGPLAVAIVRYADVAGDGGDGGKR